MPFPTRTHESALRAGVHRSTDALSEEWEALADRTHASPFRRPGWVHIWGKHFSTAPIEVLTVRRDDELVALLPVMRWNGLIRSPTNFHTPEFGVLAEDRAAAASLFRSLFTESHHQISLAFIEEDGEEVACCLAAADAYRERVLIRPQQQSPFVELDSTDWSAFESRLSAKLRADLRRRSRRLEEAGEVSFQVADGRADLDSLLAEGFAVEPSEWKARKGTSIASRADTSAFYRDVAEWAAERDLLRLSFLRLNGRPIAFQFGLEDKAAYYFLKGGYDVALRAFAPGKLLVGRMLARALECGLRRFEFLGAAEPWKMEWTTTCRSRVTIRVFPRGPVGYAGWLANRYARPAGKRLVASYRRWGLQQLPTSRDSAVRCRRTP
jgi:CelD/BcsL family acetyltransferase involved in cellulose biosynthesis